MRSSSCVVGLALCGGMLISMGCEGGAVTPSTDFRDGGIKSLFTLKSGANGIVVELAQEFHIPCFEGTIAETTQRIQQEICDEGTFPAVCIETYAVTQICEGGEYVVTSEELVDTFCYLDPEACASPPYQGTLTCSDGNGWCQIHSGSDLGYIDCECDDYGGGEVGGQPNPYEGYTMEELLAECFEHLEDCEP